MKKYYVVGILLVSATTAPAQTLDQTFDQIGSKLQSAQQTLTAPTPGMEVQLPSDVVVYERPDVRATTPLKLDAKAPVTYQGTENGFAKVTARNVPQPFYVKDDKFLAYYWGGSLVESLASQKLKNAMDTLKGLANDLRDNPYVRLKGFTVDVSTSPSLKIDFEMRDATGAGSTPGTSPETKR